MTANIYYHTLWRFVIWVRKATEPLHVDAQALGDFACTLPTWQGLTLFRQVH